MLCPETACGLVCALLLIWLFTDAMGGRCRTTGGRCRTTDGRRSGYLIYPYVDLRAPGPDGDPYALHTCRGR
jgi:hypothetical protein